MPAKKPRKRKPPLRRLSKKISQVPSFGIHGYSKKKSDEMSEKGIKHFHLVHWGHYLSFKQSGRRVAPRKWFDALRASISMTSLISMRGEKDIYNTETKRFEIKKYFPTIHLVIDKTGEGIKLEPESSKGFTSNLQTKYRGRKNNYPNTFPVIHDPIRSQVRDVFLRLERQELEEINKKWKKLFEKHKLMRFEETTAVIFFQTEMTELFLKKILKILRQQKLVKVTRKAKQEK